jgi:hypothetical protein
MLKPQRIGFSMPAWMNRFRLIPDTSCLLSL